LNHRVVLGDSGQMTELGDGSVSVCVTSPPYFRRKKYEIQYETFDEYRAYLRKTWKEVHRVLGDTGLLFVNIGDSFDNPFKSHDVAKDIANVGFNPVQTAIWVKGHHSPVQGKKHLNHLFEYVFIFSKTQKYSLDRLSIGVPYKDKSNIGRWKVAKKDLRCRGDVWNINYETVQSHSQKLHDAIFPKELPLMCIKLAHCGSKDLVLDPFLGSGTTILAASELYVPSIGYEINGDYENIIRMKLGKVKKLKITIQTRPG
jgi:site-specific DNA-methyltransferase (adenine-specific)